MRYVRMRILTNTWCTNAERETTLVKQSVRARSSKSRSRRESRKSMSHTWNMRFLHPRVPSSANLASQISLQDGSRLFLQGYSEKFKKSPTYLHLFAIDEEYKNGGLEPWHCVRESHRPVAHSSWRFSEIGLPL
eukprot:13990-Amorphochlora_amoeboformis.AAC.1